VPLTTTQDGNLLTLHVEGAIDSHLGAEMQVATTSGLAAGTRRFLVNLQRAKQANSAGLEALVSSARAVAGGGGRLALVGTTPLLADVFAATRLDRRFALFDSTEQAIATLRRGF
jgi:anti-anti-sigma factor